MQKSKEKKSESPFLFAGFCYLYMNFYIRVVELPVDSLKHVDPSFQHEKIVQINNSVGRC